MPGSGWDWSGRVPNTNLTGRASGPFGGFPLGFMDRAGSPNVSKYYAPAPGDKMTSPGRMQPSPGELTEKLLIGLAYQGNKKLWPNYAFYSAGEYYNGNAYLVSGLGWGSVILTDIWRWNVATQTMKWMAALPDANSYGSCSAIIGDTIYVFGGYSSGGYSRRLWAYNITNNSVTTLTSSAGPSARGYGTFTAVGTKIYYFGGYDATGARFNDLWEYDTSNNTWTQKTSGASVRRFHSACVYDDCIYICAGDTTSSVGLYDLWKYDPSDDSWTQKTSTNSNNARANHSAFVYGDYMYTIHGGYYSDQYKICKYDFAGNSWSYLGNHTTLDGYHGFSFFDGTVWTSMGNTNTDPKDYWFTFDCSTDTYSNPRTFVLPNNTYNGMTANTKMGEYNGKLSWFNNGAYGLAYAAYSRALYLIDLRDRSVTVSAAILPAGRAYAATCDCNGKLYIFGGRDTSNADTVTLYAWDYATDSIATLTSCSGLSGALYSHLVDGGNGYLYLIPAGNLSGDALYVWRYDIVGDSWTKMTAQAPDNGYLFSTFRVGNRIYVTGGQGGLTRFRYYDIDADAYTNLAARAFSVRYCAGAQWLDGDYLCTMIGEDGGNTTAAVWRTNLTTLVDQQLGSRSVSSNYSICRRVAGGVGFVGGDGGNLNGELAR